MDNFWLTFILLIIAGMTMYVPYGPFFAHLTEILPTNVVGGPLHDQQLWCFGCFRRFLSGWLSKWFYEDSVHPIFLWPLLYCFQLPWE
jgi:hypothetical protein